MAAREFAIAFTIAGQMASSFKGAFQGAQNVMKATSQAMQALNSQAGDIRGMQNHKEAVAKAAKAHLDAKNKMQQMIQSAKQEGTELDRNSKEFKQVEKSVKDTAKALDTARQKMAEYSKSSQFAGQSMQQLKAAQAQVQQRLALQAKFQAGKQQFDDNKMHLAALGMMGYGVIKQAISVGMDFEATMAKVGAIARASEEDMQALEATARKLGKETKFSAKEAGEGMTYLAMAGYSTKDIMAVMPSVLQLSAASGLDLATTSDIATGILSAFGQTGENVAKNMQHLNDVLALAASTAKVDVQGLGESMKYVAPVAKSYGLSMEMATAMVAKLGDANISGSQAGTVLRGIMTRVATSGQKAMKALKIATTEVRDGKIEMRGMDAIMGDLAKKFESMGSAERMKWAKEIVGQQNVAGFLALVENSKNIQGSFAKMSDDLKNADGTAATMAKRMGKTTAGQMKILESAWGEFQISAFKALQPILGVIGEGLQVVVDALNALNEYAPGVSSALVTIAAGFGLLLVAVPICTMVGGAFAALQGAFTMMTAVIAANPVILALAAIVAAGIGLYLLVTYWDDVTDAIKSVVDGFVGYLKNQWNTLVDNFWELVGMISVGLKSAWDAAWKALAVSFNAIWSGIKSAAKGYVNYIIECINTAIRGLNAFGNIKMPEWVPGVGGKSVGLNIPQIPKLAQGGIVSQPTMALIGEGRESEAVLPLSKLNNLLSSVQPQVNINMPDFNMDSIGKAIRQFIGFKMPQMPSFSMNGLKTIWDSTVGGLLRNFRMPQLPGIPEMPKADNRPPEAIQQLGNVINSDTSNSNSISLNFAPVINVQGTTSDDVYAKVRNGLDEGARNLKSELERLMANQRRLSYA